VEGGWPVSSEPLLRQRLKWAGVLTAAGLLVEVATLYFSHPLMFLAFILLGGSLVGAGVVIYLFSIVTYS
jgi:hypothetical protein